MPYDAIVIGAGMSGLGAALRLALHGRRVVLLEKHELWGGLNSFYTLGGRRFDVGLHALTNFVRSGTDAARGAPLTRLLRALRIRHEELRLGEQSGSEIAFPGARLAFTNDPAVLEAEVARIFPGERDGFAALASWVRAFEPREDRTGGPSARAVLERHLHEPLLREMLLLPLLFYGSARADDTDEQTFAILFRALFLEGLCRPEGGIRTLLNLLVKRARQAGVELRLSAGVRRVLVAGGAAHGVELENGEVLEAPVVLSSAGAVETLALAGRATERSSEGRLSFLESIWVLDRPAHALGHRAATLFFSLEERAIYRRPSGLIDARAGVLSSADNFAHLEPRREGELRVSVLANHTLWKALAPEEYAAAKERAADEAAAAAVPFTVDFRPHRVFRDVFTPATIERFTGHRGGAVYGSPEKHLDGRCGIDGLVLIGTDQGYLGVIGALISGVTMANRHVLARSEALRS